MLNFASDHFLRRWRRSSVAALALVTLTLAAACGGGGDSDAEPSATPIQTSSMTVETKGTIDGQNGKTLLVVVSTESGQPVSRVCTGIGSDEFSLAPRVFTNLPNDEDPCSGVTEVTMFPGGNYVITAGIYTPPSEKAEQLQIRQVTVNPEETTVVELLGGSLSE